MNPIVIYLICLQILSLFEGSLCSTNSSWEHHIRADLLDNYDRKVRPVRRGKRVVEVQFALRVGRLVKVDNQEQVVVMDTWVIQQWQNEFLQWNASDYDDVDRIHFAPDEIWVPDIALFNNGDDEINLAGGPSKFVTDVAVNDKGKCTWSGPATFKVNCEMEVDKWPFDEQTCKLAFGSYTYGLNLLKIKLFRDRSKFTNRFVESGNWKIEDITAEISETDHGNCCNFNFSEAVYAVKMKRKSLYYTFYLTIPCVILTILALSSFLVHVESGERIGFVTTVLLAMTVFLLVIPSFLPVTSDGLPVLGVLLEGTMIIITLILFANIFVLWVYFREGTPPVWVQKICWFCGRRKTRNVQQIHAAETEGLHPAIVKSSASMAGIEMNESNRGTPTPVQHAHRVEEHLYSWHRVSTKMDRAFFVAFVIVSFIAYVVYIASSL